MQTDRVPVRCHKCERLIPFDEEVVIDPETGKATMEGEPFHAGCAPSKITPKMLTVTRLAIEKLNLPWEVREDQYDPDYPGIVIEGHAVFFATIGEDGRWMVGAWKSPPAAPQEIMDGEEEYWWQALKSAGTWLLRLRWEDAIGFVMYDNEDLRPEGF